ncbi:uncharacterized protein PODANS_1_14960, partial [Podospora anserina S mat+]
CLDSKRECIFKTGPRTRRPKQSKRSQSSTDPTTATAGPPSPSHHHPAPPKPSQSTSPMPCRRRRNRQLRGPPPGPRVHTQQLGSPPLLMAKKTKKMNPSTDYDYDKNANTGLCSTPSRPPTCGSVISSHASSLPIGASALSTPPSSTTTAATTGTRSKQKSRMVASLGLQPQFNVDSAGKLLQTFTGVMLNHFHCLVIDPERDTVASLAKERPFVLLAVLAAASGSRTLQGHSLYDEEFRKILGLKFVAGGERSLELLQGLVVYIAWYPFHLRPKNKQAYQYIRMAVDIVFDLELNEDPGTDRVDVPPTEARLEEIRTFAATWGRTPTLAYNTYTAHCCEMLSRHSPLKGDQVLVWQVRLQRLVEETNDLRRTQRGGAHSQQSEYQINLMIRGMETQLKEWEACMSRELKNTHANPAPASLRILLLFTPLFLSGAPLFKLPSAKLTPLLDPSQTTFRADASKLSSLIPTLREFYSYFLSLPAQEINAFMGQEWGSFILVIILGFRMCFPMAICPDWDDKWRERG